MKLELGIKVGLGDVGMERTKDKVVRDILRKFFRGRFFRMGAILRRRGFANALISIVVVLGLSMGLWNAPAYAGLHDDDYDGNIFALYAGNGSIVPPKFSLAQSLKQDKPTLLFFYVDDSRDSKEFSPVVSQLQAPYGRVANFIAIAADSVLVKESYEENEPGYYFEGAVPQTVVFDQQGNVVLNEVGQIPYEMVDDEMRKLFDLLPREESQELKQRSFNEVNSELVDEN